MSFNEPARQVSVQLAVTLCERIITRFQIELEQPTPATDAGTAHRAVVAAQIDDYRRRIAALQKAA